MVVGSNRISIWFALPVSMSESLWLSVGIYPLRMNPFIELKDAMFLVVFVMVNPVTPGVPLNHLTLVNPNAVGWFWMLLFVAINPVRLVKERAITVLSLMVFPDNDNHVTEDALMP